MVSPVVVWCIAGYLGVAGRSLRGACGRIYAVVASLDTTEKAWFLSKQGLLVSNLVFDSLYFSSSDLVSRDDFSTL